MNQSMSHSAVPSAVATKLRMVRQRKIWVQVTTAIVAAVAVLLTAMAIAMLIDWLATLYDSRWRVVLMGAALVMAAATGAGWIFVASKRGLRWERVALDVDRQLPQMEERMTTMTRLGQAADDPHVVHPAMLRRMATEATRWEPHVDPEQVVSMSTLGRAMIGLSAIAAALGIAVLMDSHRTLVLMRRFWQPGTSISATELTSMHGDLVVAKGEPVELAAVVKGSPVDQALLSMQSEVDGPQTITLVASRDEPFDFMHRLRTVESPFRYQFRAGDGHSGWHNVNVAERPEIAALQMTITPPAYTGRLVTTFNELPRRTSTLEKSTLELAIRPTQPLKSLQLRMGDDELIELAVDETGWYRWTKTLDKSLTLSPLLTEAHGLTNRRVLKSQINVLPDKPPVVKITTPDDQVAVRPDDTVEIHFTAVDDNGIADAELVVFADADEETEGEQVPLMTIPIPLDEQTGSRKVEGTVALDLSKLETTDGSRLSYEIRVRESRDGNVNAAAAERDKARGRAPGKQAAGPPANRMAMNEARPAPAAASSPPGTTPPSSNSSNPQNADSQPNAENKTAESTSDAKEQTAPTESENAAKTDSVADANPPSESSTQNAKDQNATPQDAKSGGPAQNSMLVSSDPPSEPGSSLSRASEMPSRSLDVQPAQASSSRMRIQVDEWAGSFDGQQRQKLEIAIAPELEALDAALARAQTASREVLDELEADSEWRGKHDRDMTNAERATVEAQQVIRRLTQRTNNTPYAYIGLQLTDIGAAHVGPGRQNFWTSLQTDGEARVNSVRDGWQHVTRARQMVADLEGQFERARREFALAEKLQQIKKMYQVFLEDSFSLLGGEAGDPNRYARDVAELNVDEEYLKRLREVLEMRREMEKELARILAEDPRMLKRFMDSFRNRSANLREDLADLVTKQNDLNREVQAWSRAEDADRVRVAQILLQRHLYKASEMAEAAGELQDRYQTWLPLAREAEDADLQSATKLIQATANAANELATKVTAFDEETRRVRQRPAADAANPEAAAKPAWDPDKAVGVIRENADVLSARLRELDIELRQMGAREDDAEIAVFAGNRLVEARRLIADTTSWSRQLDEHRAGNYSRAAEVEQYRLAEQTERLANRLGDIEQNLAGLLQRPDQTLPENIAEKAREVIAALDKQASPNQLGAVYALRADQLPRAAERQQAAHEGLVAAEKAYDEMMQRAIVELDKLPVRDPIASLLEDPTLDELLALLEQERALADLLGLSGRPTNLQIVGDWMRPGNMGGGGRMAWNQLRQRGERARNRIDRSYRAAIARALDEGDEPPILRAATDSNVNWNRLVAELEDELNQGRDKAPPEQYRQAISQYFDEISRAAATTNEDRP